MPPLLARAWATLRVWLGAEDVKPPLVVILLLAHLYVIDRAWDVARAVSWQARLVLPEPSPIQWLEPLFYRSALRFASGEPLYGPPSLDYIGGMYTPGVDWLNGTVLALFGPGYPSLRVAAALAYAGVVIVWMLVVHRSTKSPLLALAFCGALLALGEPLNHWFTTVNVDAWYLLFGGGGLLALVWGGATRVGVTIAALSLAASFLCKPQGFLFAVGAFLWLCFFERRHVKLYAVVCATVAGVPCLWLLATSQGWFWQSVVLAPLSMPKKDGIEVLKDLLASSQLSTVAFFAGGAALIGALHLPETRRAASLFLAFATGVLVITWNSFAKIGGGANSLYPLLSFGLLLAAIAPAVVGRSAPSVRFAQLVFLAMFMKATFVGTPKGAEDIANHKSLDAMRAQRFAHQRAFAKEIDKILAAAGENVFVGVRSDVQHARGLPAQLHQTPLVNLTVRTKIAKLDDVIGEAIDKRRFAKMLVWQYEDNQFEKRLDGRYQKTRTLRDPNIGIPVNLWEALPPTPVAPPPPAP